MKLTCKFCSHTIFILPGKDEDTYRGTHFWVDIGTHEFCISYEAFKWNDQVYDSHYKVIKKTNELVYLYLSKSESAF